MNCFNCGKQLSHREMDRKRHRKSENGLYCDSCFIDILKEKLSIVKIKIDGKLLNTK